MPARQIQEELPPEGSQEEAEEIVRQFPVRMPTYELKRVHVATLNVDYAPPHGSGYARPLSQGRLRQLRREWDPFACAPLVISRRDDGTYWVIDGNHRRVIAYEKGIQQLPAQVFTGLERSREADLYTKHGTVLGQTPWTRFQSKLAAGDGSVIDIKRIALRTGFEVDANGYQDSRIQAVARVEWVYARGGPQGLEWTLGFLMNAFNGERESLGEMQLEGVFSFYLRYADKVERDDIARLIGAGGIVAWHDRAASIWGRVDVGRRSNTYGMAIADVTNDTWRKKGVGVKKLLPAWTTNLGHFQPFHDVSFSSRMNWAGKSDHVPAPQHLGEES